MPKARTILFLVVIIAMGLLPKAANAHSGPILDDLAIVGVAQLIAGPALIAFSRFLKGVRLVTAVGFFLGVALSWALFLTGHSSGISNEAFDSLTQGFSARTVDLLDVASFYVNFVAIPYGALAVVWSVYALRRKSTRI